MNPKTRWIVSITAALASTAAGAASMNWASVDQAIGRKGVALRAALDHMNVKHGS